MDRKDWMGLMARAPAGRWTRLFFRAWGLSLPMNGCAARVGGVHGSGAGRWYRARPFNLGEMTVTAALLTLNDGRWACLCAGARNKREQAEQAALVDAADAGGCGRSCGCGCRVLVPLAAADAGDEAPARGKAAAT